MKKIITNLAIAMLGFAFVSNAQVYSTSQSGSVDSSYTGAGNGVNTSYTGSESNLGIVKQVCLIHVDSSYTWPVNGGVDSSYTWPGNGGVDSSYTGPVNGGVDSSYTGHGNGGVDSSYTWPESAIFDSLTVEEVPSGLNISWHSDSTNNSYCVQVATDVAFTNLITNVCNLYTNSYEVLFNSNSDTLGNDSTSAYNFIDCQFRPVSLVIASYYWRVGATDVNSNTIWSAPRVKTISKTMIINGLESEFASSTVSVYPNPSSDVLYVTGSDAASVELLDVNGVLVLSANGNAAAKGLNVANVAAGIYVLKVNEGAGIKTFRIIKQ